MKFNIKKYGDEISIGQSGYDHSGDSEEIKCDSCSCDLPLDEAINFVEKDGIEVDLDGHFCSDCVEKKFLK